MHANHGVLGQLPLKPLGDGDFSCNTVSAHYVIFKIFFDLFSLPHSA
jgi:hypothetical protein